MNDVKLAYSVFFIIMLLGCVNEYPCTNKEYSKHYQEKSFVVSQTEVAKDSFQYNIHYAIELLDTAIMHCKNNYILYVHKAILYNKINEYKMAIKCIDTALYLNQGFIEGITFKGITYEKMNNHDLASLCFRRAFDMYNKKKNQNVSQQGGYIVNQAILLLLMNRSKEHAISFVNEKIIDTKDDKLKKILEEGKGLIYDFNRETFIKSN